RRESPLAPCRGWSLRSSLWPRCAPSSPRESLPVMRSKRRRPSKRPRLRRRLPALRR
ncbi:unnamed protein product, partial [Ectocarpus fasciculatus]